MAEDVMDLGPLRVEANDLTLDDLIWLTEWMERRDKNSAEDLRRLRDLIVRCGNWPAERIGSIKLREMQTVLAAAFQESKQVASVPFAKESS